LDKNDVDVSNNIIVPITYESELVDQSLTALPIQQPAISQLGKVR